MKHTKYLRAGSLVCLLALCLGLLTACGGATLPLDKLYVDDARPGKPVTLNTATEVFREKGTLEEVYGNLALFITRNEDSSLLKEIVCNLASGKKLYESEAYHERRMVDLLDGDLYSVRTPQDGGDSVLTLYDAAGKQQFRAEGASVLDRDLLYAKSSVYRIKNGKVKDSGIPLARAFAAPPVLDYAERPSDGYMMELKTTDGRMLTVYDLGMNPVAQYRFPSDAAEESGFCRMLNNGDVLIQYQLEVGRTDNTRITEDEYDFEQNGKLIRLCTLILSAKTGEVRSISFDGVLVNCQSRRYYNYQSRRYYEAKRADLSDKVDNIVAYTPLDGNGRIDSQMVWAVMDNDGTVHPVEKLSNVPPVGVPYPLGKDFWMVQLWAGGNYIFQLYNKSGKLLKSAVEVSGTYQFKIGWDRFSDYFDIYDESGDVVLEGGKLRVTVCAAMYAVLQDSETQEYFLYVFDGGQTVPLPCDQDKQGEILSTADSLILTRDTDNVYLYNYRGELLGTYPNGTSARFVSSGKNNWLAVKTTVNDVQTTTVYKLTK